MRVVNFVLATMVAFWSAESQGIAAGNDAPMPVPGIEYTWQLSDSEARDLIKKIKSLRYGDRLDDVRRRLGKAAFDEEMCGKRLGDCRGHVLEYPIRRVRPEGGNVYDQTINLFFDVHGRLDQISFQSMPPLVGDVVSSHDHGSDARSTSYSTRPPARQSTE